MNCVAGSNGPLAWVDWGIELVLEAICEVSLLDALRILSSPTVWTPEALASITIEEPQHSPASCTFSLNNKRKLGAHSSYTADLLPF